MNIRFTGTAHELREYLATFGTIDTLSAKCRFCGSDFQIKSEKNIHTCSYECAKNLAEITRDEIKKIK